MWKTLNSPICITVVVLAALFSYQYFKKDPVTIGIRSIYNEILSIGEDAKDDLEMKKLIEAFLKEAGKQIKSGISSSFNTDANKKEEAEKNKLYFETKSLIKISSPKVLENKQYTQPKKEIIYEVTNSSEKYLGKVAHTIALYNHDDLVGVQEEWGQIKLAPGESKAYSTSIHNGSLIFDIVKINMDDISILDVAK
jgi:hypothetical protein